MPEDDLQVKVGIDTSEFESGVDSMSDSISGLERSFASAMRGVGREVEHGMAAMTRLDLVQITLQQSADRVTEAQDKYTQAVERFGPASSQAADAAQRVKTAEEDLSKAHMHAEISTGLIVVQVIRMATELPKVAKEMREAGAAARLFAADMGIMLTVETAGIAAIAIAGALVMLNAALSSNATVAQSSADSYASLNQQMAELGKRIEANQILLRHQSGTDVQNAAKKQLDEQGDQMEDLGQRMLKLIHQDAEAYARNEEEKVILARGTKDQVLTILADEKDKARALDAKLRTDLDDESRRSIQAQKDAQDSRVATVQSALQRINSAEAQQAAEERRREEDSARAVKAAWDETIAGLRNSMSALGVDISQLGPEMLHSLAVISPEMASIVDSTQSAHDAEREFARHILQTGNPALISQMHIQQQKGESAEALAASLGITVEQEKALAKQGVITTGVLNNQSTAMDATAEAANPQTLEGLLAGHEDDFVQGIFGTKLRGTKLKELEGKMDIQGIISALESGKSGVGIAGVGAFTGDVGSETWQKAMAALQRIILANADSSKWDALLSTLHITNVEAAATARPSTQNTHIGTVNVYANDAKGGQAAGDAFTRSIKRTGTNG